MELAQTLAIAFKQRQKPQHRQDQVRLPDRRCSAFRPASSSWPRASARKKAMDIEDRAGRRVPGEACRRSAQALAKFFGVPYEPFKSDRIKPIGPAEEPEARVRRAEPVDADRRHARKAWWCCASIRSGSRSSRIVNNVFPQGEASIYRVTTQRDFKETLNHVLRRRDRRIRGDIGDMLSGLDDDDDGEDGRRRATTSPPRPTTNWSSWSTRSSSTPTTRAPRTSTSSPTPARTRPRSASARTATLQPYIEVPASYRNAIVARLKIMCDLDISEKREAAGRQDQVQEIRPARHRAAGGDHSHRGRRRGRRDADPRRRRADSARQAGPDAAQPENAARTRSSKPYGLFFVCGPTGSGKTTTLHSVLKYLNTPDTKIWTAEDPVEITQKGLRQVQVNKKAGLDFADGDEGLPARRPGHHHGRRDARQGNHRAPASRPRSPATWCSPRCTPTARRNRSSACSTWAWTRSTSPMPCSASWRSAWPSACAQVQGALHARTPTRSSRS